MSDEAPRSITEFDYFHSVIEFTKICSEKCGVLKGKDDKLDNTEITCLSKIPGYRNSYYNRAMRKQCKGSQKHITKHLQTSIILYNCITKLISVNIQKCQDSNYHLELRA